MKQMRMAVSLLLLISILCGMAVSAAADGTDVNDVHPVSFVFYSDIDPNHVHLDAAVPYGDSLFEEAATEYHHTLAQASLGLALSNFREKGKTAEEQGYAVRDFLTAVGFTDIQADQYDVDTTSDTVASMIARKQIMINGEPCTLIAVSICGAGYKNEWLSNFAFSGEERHAGFDRAADKVLGRLLLYLYNHPSEDHVKLWISGYSRAAAIANLLGQKLSNEKLCPVEDLYVYTFACPNTAIAESAWSCPSIFNIVGSFDPFPTIPPVEWGYFRYGTTFFLPAQEVDSHYARHREAVDSIYKDLTGVRNWNNPSCNWILQKLFQIIYSSVDSADIYASFLKDIISGMYVTRGIRPRIRLLFDMMNASADTDSSIRGLFSSIKDVFSPFLYHLLAHTDGEERKYWGDNVSALTQIIHEHNPEVYYTWVISSNAPEDLFLSSFSYNRISLISGLKVESVSRTEADKQIQVSDISEITFDINAILNIPGDYPYIIDLTAERDINAERLTINRYTLPSQKAEVAAIAIDLKAGERGQLILPLNGLPSLRKLDAAEAGPLSVQARIDAQNEKEAAGFEYHPSGWLAKNLLDLLLWIPVLLIFAFAFCVIRLNYSRKTKAFHARRAFATLMIVFFLLDQMIRNLFPWDLLLINICEGVCILCSALIAFFAWLRKKDRYTLLLLFAMIFWAVGDALSEAGALMEIIFFSAGHLILCFAFCGERRPNRRQILILIAASVLLLAPEIITTADPVELIPSVIYSVLLLAMTVFSFTRGRKAFRGALLFMASDFLLLLCKALNAPAWLFFISMGAYYLGTVLLASDAYGEETPVVRTDKAK